MPEIWFPYGAVETLVTIQAENLGAIVEPAAEKSSEEIERLSELAKVASGLLLCDSKPTSVELLRNLMGALGGGEPPKVTAVEPKKIESAIPELKGKVLQIPQANGGEGGDVAPAEELLVPGRKVFIGTSRPDPLFGIVDAKVQACLNWVQGALQSAAGRRKDFEPSPFQKTDSYEMAEELAEGIKDATFLDVIPRGGKVRAVLEDAPFDAVKNGFLESSLPQARGIIVGAGGRGCDDTFSAVLRSIWGVLPGVRRSGEILLISECTEGLGSPALEMLASGRIAGDEGRKRERYVNGLEEIYYLSKLKEEYNVLLLSGLPEFFARNKLGLTTAKGSGEAVGRLLNKLGRTAKVNVVTRASECRVLSA